MATSSVVSDDQNAVCAGGGDGGTAKADGDVQPRPRRLEDLSATEVYSKIGKPLGELPADIGTCTVNHTVAADMPDIVQPCTSCPASQRKLEWFFKEWLTSRCRPLPVQPSCSWDSFRIMGCRSGECDRNVLHDLVDLVVMCRWCSTGSRT